MVNRTKGAVWVASLCIWACVVAPCTSAETQASAKKAAAAGASQAASSPIQIKFPGGRIALSSDGNIHDEDDLGGTALALAMITAAGLADKLVHYDYSDHLGANKNQQMAAMIESALGGADRFKLDKTRFFNDQIQMKEAIENFRDEGNESSADNPLWYICAGPMEAPWRCINAVDPDKRKFIHCISHSDWNEQHGDTPEMTHKWEDIKALGVVIHRIKDQNTSQNVNGVEDGDFNSDKAKWSWLKESSNPDWQWLYNRNIKSTFDVSDAGMTFWLITGGPNGGIETGGSAETKFLLENPVKGPDQPVARVPGKASLWVNSTPVVSNVTTRVRAGDPKVLDIYYDLADAEADACTIWVMVSSNGGATWEVPASGLSGHVGPKVAPERKRHVVLDAGSGVPNLTGKVQVRVLADDGRCLEGMVMIPAGEFAMGSNLPSKRKGESVHNVYVDAFMMGRYLVTNGQYCEFLNDARSQGRLEVRSDHIVYTAGSGGHALCETTDATPVSRISFNDNTFSFTADRGEHPIVKVTWWGAIAYANWRSKKEGWQECYDLSTGALDPAKHGFRLPTEAEWEYAARGGLAGKRYPWGDSHVSSQANSWNSGDPFEFKEEDDRADTYPWTTPVGFYNGKLHQKASFNWPTRVRTYQTADGVNGYGLYDMVGNVWQMCDDWYSESYYASSPAKNPPGAASGKQRISRGGSWHSGPDMTWRYVCASGGTPSDSLYHFGFRLVLDFSSP